MKMIMISGGNSGSGKTLVSIGLLRALRNKGLKICGFKTGPDFIDKQFLEIASGRRGGNLDLHLMRKEGILNGISLGEGDYSIIEGAMGYFDGIYNTFENSSYDIARKLNINTILVYRPKGEMFSTIPKIKGMVDFKESKIKGLILNGIRKDLYPMYKEQIEKYIDIKVLGFVENNEELELASRHLGLIQSEEIENIEEKLDKIASIVEENICIDSLLELMKDIKVSPFNYPQKRNITVAIPLDKAFSFYYTENLQILEKICNVVYFSPLEDNVLPVCDLLYIGGGYPEIYKEELSSNLSMINSIKKHIGKGGFTYGEGGGLMYLVEEIEGAKMCGIFRGSSIMTNRLQRFGYVNIEIKEDCLLGEGGDILSGHEFHRSITNIEDKKLFNISKPKSKRTWECGYSYKNTLVGYPHIHFLGNKKALNNLLTKVEEGSGNFVY